MQPRLSTWGLVWVLCWSFLTVGVLSPVSEAATEAAQSRRQIHERRRRWLQSAREKVMKDSRRLVESAAELCVEAGRPAQDPLTPELLQQVEALEPEARKLLAAVEEFDENFLPVSVVTTAEKIEAEAKSLRQALRALPQFSHWNKLARLVRQVQKRADSIKDRTRMP